MLEDSDEEANPDSTTPSVAACPSKGGVVSPDALETQAFDVNTQVLSDVLIGLDKVVPSPARRFADDKTMVLSPPSVDVKSPDALPASRVEPETTPSPRGIVPVDVTPIKDYPTRDQQLAVKGTNEAEKKAKQAAAKAAKEAAEASRGRGRGRGGRGRGQKPTPVVDEGADGAEDQPEVSDKPVEEVKKKKGGRPKKVQREPESEAVNKKPRCEAEPESVDEGADGDEPEISDKPIEEVKKKKDGRPKKVQREPESEATVNKKPRCEPADTKPTKRGGKKGDATQEVPAVPAARVRGKRSIDKEPELKPNKKVQTLSGMEWPNTFARRYRPAKPNFTQKFWEGCVCAYRNVLAPHLLPGTATAIQARGFRLYKIYKGIVAIGFRQCRRITLSIDPRIFYIYDIIDTI